MKLRDFTWWPGKWNTIYYQDVQPDQVAKVGIFQTCKLTSRGLMIEVSYHGITVLGRMPQPSFNLPENLVGLRDFLLQHTGEPLATVEDLEVTPDQFNTRR